MLCCANAHLEGDGGIRDWCKLGSVCTSQGIDHNLEDTRLLRLIGALLETGLRNGAIRLLVTCVGTM